MRLHYNWMVLVTIFWTILLNVSAQQSITNVPRVRGFEKKKSVKNYEENLNSYSRGNGNSMDDDRNKIPESAAISSRGTTKSRINMERGAVEDVGATEANNWHRQEHTQTHGNMSTSISKDNIDTNNEYLKPVDKHHYANKDASLVKLDLHGALSLVSSTDNITVSRGTNENMNSSKQSVSNFSKVQDTEDVKFNIFAGGSNGSAHQELVLTDRASNLARVSENAASLITNSNVSRMNHPTPDLSLETPSDEYDRSLSGVRPTMEYSSGKTLPMDSSSENIDFTGKHNLIRKVVRLSSSDENSKHDGLSSPDTRRRISSSSVANIGFANYGIKNNRKNKWLPSNIRSSISETSKIRENKDTSNIVKAMQEITANALSPGSERIVGDETITTLLSHRSDEKLDSNKFNKIKRVIENHDTKDFPANEQIHVNDLAHSGTFGLFVSPEYLTQRKAYRIIIPSSAEDENEVFITTGGTNNINLVPFANDISRALFEEESDPNSEPHNTGTYNAEISISTGRTDENFQHTNVMGRPYLTSLSSKGLSEINGEQVAVARRIEDVENEASRRKRSGDVKNNEGVEVPDVIGGMKRVRSNGEFVDNAANPGGTGGNKIHRNVVKIALTGFQTEQRSHKSLIVQDSTEGINPCEDQIPEHVLERKDQVRKLFLEMDTPEIGGSRVSEDGASGSITLQNSSAFSYATVVQRESKVLESSEARKRTRKMEFSKSDLDDTQASGIKKSGGDRVISLTGATEVSPASLRVGAKDQGLGVVEKNLANLIEKIDWHIATDTPSSTGSPFPELHPRDCGPDDSGKSEYDCNGDGVTTEVVRLPGIRQQRKETFAQLRDKDSTGTKLSGSRIEIRSKLVAALVSSSHIESVDNDASVAAVASAEKGSKIRKDKTVEDQLTASNRFISILSKVQPGTNHITSVTRPVAVVDKNNQDDNDVPTEYGFFRQRNIKRKLKIDESNSATTINSLKDRDSSTVEDDSSKIRRETRNHTGGKTVDAKLCETCQIVGSAETSSIEHEGKGAAGSGRRSHKNFDHDTKNIESSIMDFQEIGSTIRARITTTNEISVDPVFIVSNGSSLANASAEFKVIDHSRPEARVGEQLQQEDTRMLVRGQEPIFIAPERENLILSRERVVERPLGSRKLNTTTEAVSLGSIIDQRNENNENGLDAHLDAKTQERHFYSPVKKKAYAGHTRGPFIPRVIESFTDGRNSSAKFSNNALTIPRSRKNFSRYATAQTGSPSSSGRRRKSLDHDAVRGGSTSSTKTDSSISSIGRTSDDDGYSMRKEPLQISRSGVSSMSSVHGELEDDIAAGQIKRGFTSEDTITIYVTEPTTRRYSEYTSAATVLSPEIRDINPTENIIRAIEGDIREFGSSITNVPIVESRKLSTNNGTLPQEIASNPVADISNVNLAISGSDNNNEEFVKSFDEQKSSRLRERGSVSLQRPRSGQARENVRINLEAGDAQSLNHTDRDNSTRITATLNQWPVKHSAVVEGDLLLGGLMMVHEREDSITCGPVMPQGGVQALEAMLYTLDWLNKRDLVPGVKIGAHILDDCDKDTYGLEMAVDFIKGSISNIDGAEYHCNKTAVRKVISGVVGAASSVTSIQVANLLRLFRIPQVSFFSTSPELSNKMRFEYFTRTIPSDHYQVKAMVDIVLLMGWSYVSIIYEESNYGEKAYEELEKLLGKHQICIAVKEKLSKDSGVAEAHVYDNIVLKLLTKPRARGCIIFASDQEVAGVMKAVKRCNATGAFSWIGSDGWSARSLVSDGNEPEMEGTLSVQPQANPVDGFEDYFLNLTVQNNRRNPWFVEFWEDHFKCRYPNASQTPYNNYTVECTTTEKLTKQNTAFEDQLQFVSDAVLAFAYAFREMHKDLCRGNAGLCDAMKPTKGTELLNYLRNVEFKGLSGDVFHFDKNGDGPARYNIIHFKQVSPGKYKWIRVGKYLEGELRLNMSEIQFRLGHPEPPESVCSLPCEVGQAKKYVEGESCCWHCFNCTQYQIRHLTDEKQCVLCPQGTVPDETHSYCRDIPEEFLRPESGWAIGAMSFSSTGILITLFVGGVFLKHNDTPIVRASGRELSYVLLTGILLCYLVTFALVLRPNDIVCSIQRFSAGFCFTVVYAALLTKTNRISRIFNAGKHSAKRPSFISPRSQLIICSMLVGVQILINAVWVVIDPAKAMHHYPTREDNLLVCNSYMNASYMIAFTYPIILIVVCTVYAVLTRKIPEAFNESKHIGFTMYTTCVIWLAFVPLYFATGSHVALRITSMSVTISLSASVTIACLFSPKLYIILIHPERNVRPNMMMQNRYNTTKGSVSATNASSMLAPVTLTAVTCDQNKAVKKHVITTIDCSTQIEQYEMELKDQKNGKISPAVVTRETQTLLNNNGKESNAVASPVIKDIITEENIISSRGLNIGKIANGPMNQNELPL